MNKEIPTRCDMHARRMSFVKASIANGVLERLDLSEENRDIGIVYNLNYVTTDIVRRLFPKPTGELTTAQWISKVSKKFLMEVWRHSDPRLKTGYSLDELFTAKANNTRSISFRKPKVEISPKKSSYQRFRDDVEQKTDYEELQKLLEENNLKYIYIRQIFKRDRKVIITLSDTLHELGFWPGNGDVTFFMEKLKESHEIPCVTWVNNRTAYSQAYHFILNKPEYKKMIAEIVNTCPELQKFKKPAETIFKTSKEALASAQSARV